MEEPVRKLRPSFRYMIIHFFGAVFLSIWIVLSFGSLVLASPIIGFFTFVFVICGSMLWSYLSLVTTWVELREEGIFIQRGIIAKNRSTLLYSQIQDVKETQTIWDMLMGTKSITVVTMTGLSAAAGKLPPFNMKDAEEIRSTVLREMGQKEDETSRAASVGKAGQRAASQKEQEFSENPFRIQLGKYMGGLVVALGILGVLTVVLLVVFSLLLSSGAAIGIMLSFGFLVAFAAVSLTVNLFIRIGTLKYRLGKRLIEIEYGLLSLTKITVTYDKVQDVVVRQGPIERLSGLATVKIETGAVDTVTQGDKTYVIENIVPLLAKKDALELRDFILNAMGYRMQENLVPLVKAIPLEKKMVTKRLIGAIIPMGFFSVLIGGFMGIILAQATFNPAGFFTLAIVLSAVVFAVLFALDFVAELVYYRNYFYDATNDLLVVRKGIVTLKEMILPFGKMQNIFVDQDLFDRFFGIYDVHTSTAGFRSDMEAHIDGLTREKAEKIRDFLLGQIKGSLKK